MVRHWSAALLTMVALTAAAPMGERNFTLRGDGWFDAGSARFGRLALREARFTLRDNGEFAVTLFVRNERYLVRGRWDRRGRGNVARIDITDAMGQRASGGGTLHYRNGSDPVRLQLEGRTRDGTFHADISDGRDSDWTDRGRGDRGNDSEWGRGDRLYRDIDVSMDGTGTLRFAAARDGRLRSVRARMGTNRELRLEFGGPTRGVVRGEIVSVRDSRITARVTEVLGTRASGEVTVTMRDRDAIGQINGSGGSDAGSWQLDFDADRRRGGNGDWGRDDDWGNRGMETTTRGSGWLRQDVGPSLSFDGMRVTLEDNRDATIQLEGRRQVMRLRGRWSRSGDVIRVELTQVNEMRANGRLQLRRDSGTITSLDGQGRTDRGRFEVGFNR